ncbi:hypothetical protein A8H39_01850 [Paraburkholderia fungorum]|uniref:hypothetical protein n=1 Tax=Paraburkholderia fungorum TaxID=134537 RepID=UPI00047FDB89|nr:hypothetical protein [Paraburkholderia fungorum]PNE59915.1 hypothetical protein A8H39_01850 [Paraburkholderia fungorum]
MTKTTTFNPGINAADAKRSDYDALKLTDAEFRALQAHSEIAETSRKAADAGHLIATALPPSFK